MEEITIFVKEATSEQPIRTLETILIQMEGIERALVDIDDGEVKITYDENLVGHEKIKNSIQEYGLHILE